MRRALVWQLTLFVLFLHVSAPGADAGGETGTVKGTVTLDGKPTSAVVVSVEGVADVNGPAGRTARETENALMDQRQKKFIPHVLPVSVGTTVEFPNNDDSWHNVFSTSGAKKFNVGLYPPGKSRSVTFDEPGVVRILCNVHPQMEAYVVVKSHPYFAAPDARGNYRIEGVPLGRYRLEIWHPELGTTVRPFNLVREGEVLAVDVEIEGR